MASAAWHCTLVDDDCIKNMSPERRRSSIFLISCLFAAARGRGQKKSYHCVKKKKKNQENGARPTIHCKVAQGGGTIVLNILVSAAKELGKNRQDPIFDQQGAIFG